MKIGWKCRYPIRVTNGDHLTEVQCGACLPCRIRKEQSWVLRMQLEQSAHLWTGFVTLTYAEQHRTYRLLYKHVAEFMKNLRKRFPSERVRFCCAGEYGDKTNREHWHLCLFSTIPLFDLGLTQDTLWPHGALHTGTLTPKSMRYVAAYALKSQGLRDTIWQMSRRPGIGVPAIKHLASCSAQQTGQTAVGLPSAFRLGKKLYPLDRTMRLHFQESFEAAGGKILSDGRHNAIWVDRPETLARAISKRRTDGVQLDLAYEALQLKGLQYGTF